LAEEEITWANAPTSGRFGNIRRLPEDYQGERHVVVTKSLPAKNGQEWVEFAEVPGPDPNPPPQDRRPLTCLDLVFVGPKGSEEPG